MPLSLSHKVFKWTVRAFAKTLSAVSRDVYLKAATAFVNELDLVSTIPTAKGDIRIRCVSETVRIRAREMLHREPDTLAWIDTFEPDEVLWDLGSNIGVFTLYAAIAASARVVAFDPLPHNYLALVDNVSLNGVSDRVQPYCAALTDKTKTAPLYIPAQAYTAGGAGCPFGDNVDNYGQPVDDAREHPALGFSIDDFLATFEVPFPNNMKIDIDGIQEKVIAGARKTLSDRRLKRLMIELQPNRVAVNRDANVFILRELADAGFRLVRTVGSTPKMTDDAETSVTNNFFERRER